MEWWDRMALPVKRVWSRFAARHRLQNSGLRKLGREVSTCEYEDVHVMWEMLRRSDTEISRYRRWLAAGESIEGGPAGRHITISAEGSDRR